MNASFFVCCLCNGRSVTGATIGAPVQNSGSFSLEKAEMEVKQSVANWQVNR